MMHKPLEKYTPNSPRSSMVIPTKLMPYKNSSTI